MNKTIFVLLFVALIASNTCFSQQVNLNWINHFGGEKWDVVTDIAHCGNNELVISGAYYDALGFNGDSIFSEGSRDIFLAKFTDQGKFISIKSMGSKGFDYSGKIKPDNNKGFVTSLQYERPIEVDGIKLDSLTGRNIALAFFSADLKLQTAIVMASTDKLQLTDFELADNGDFFFAGTFSGTLLFDDEKYVAEDQDIFIGQISRKGKSNFFKHYKGEGADVITAITTQKNSVYLTGTTRNGNLFGKKLRAAMLQPQMQYLFVAELNNGGNLKNVYYPTFSHDIEPVSLVCKDDKTWIAAKGKFPLHEKSMEYADTLNGYDIILYDINPKGQINQHIVTGRGRDMVKELKIAGTQLILTGTFSDTIKMQNNLLVSPKRGADVFVAAISDKGEIIDGTTILGDHGDFPCAIDVNETSVFIAGEFTDSLLVNNEYLYSSGKEDIFVANYENCGGKFPLNITIDSQTKARGQCWLLDAGDDYIDYCWNNSKWNAQEFEVKEPGTYTVQVTDKFGCIYSSEVTIADTKSAFLTESTEQLSQSHEFKLYPTVTNGLVYFEPGSAWFNKPCSVKVIDVTGRVMLSKQFDRIAQTKAPINLSELPRGAYQIEFSGDNYRESNKVILK